MVVGETRRDRGRPAAVDGGGGISIMTSSLSSSSSCFFLLSSMMVSFSLSRILDDGFTAGMSTEAVPAAAFPETLSLSLSDLSFYFIYF